MGGTRHNNRDEEISLLEGEVQTGFSKTTIAAMRETLAQKYKDLALVNQLLKQSDRSLKGYIQSNKISSIVMGGLSIMAIASFATTGFSVYRDQQYSDQLENEYNLSHPDDQNDTCGTVLHLETICDNLKNDSLLQSCIDLAQRLCAQGYDRSMTDSAMISDVATSVAALGYSVFYLSRFHTFRDKRKSNYQGAFKNKEQFLAFKNICDEEDIQIAGDATIGLLHDCYLVNAKNRLIETIQKIESDLTAQMPVRGGFFSSIGSWFRKDSVQEEEARHSISLTSMPV